MIAVVFAGLGRREIASIPVYKRTLKTLSSIENACMTTIAFQHFRSLLRPATRLALCAFASLSLCACRDSPRQHQAENAGPIIPKQLQTPDNARQRPPFRFSNEDSEFLELVQRGAFRFLWEDVNPKTKLIPDRTSNAGVVSVAGVGFQLSALPVGVERGWITKSEGETRARDVIRALLIDPAIRKAGFFQHFIDANTAGLHSDPGLEQVVSTIDSAILFAGLLTVSSYFGGDIAASSDAIVDSSNYAYFIDTTPSLPDWKRGFVSLGWKPASLSDPSGEGSLLPYFWIDTGCEHRLVTFLGVAAGIPQHRLEASTYYRLRRTLGRVNEQTVAWFPYSGALFVNQFSHCWINYSAIGKDNPEAFGFSPARRAPIDWWENALHSTFLHQQKAESLASKFKTLGRDSWGFSASDCPKGYCVTGVFPTPIAMPGASPLLDYATERPKDDPGDGTIAPYAAGTAIMFDPVRSVAALRHYAALQDASGAPLLWRDPSRGGKGLVDAFNLDKPWVSTDDVAIDQGPLLLAIENARTGLIWKLFHAHPRVREATQRLGWPDVERAVSKGQ